jgi:hypothetical protein
VPSGTTIERTPSAGAGTSVATFSVSTSKSASPRATCSPVRLSHLATLASFSPGLSLGSVTWVAI